MSEKVEVVPTEVGPKESGRKVGRSKKADRDNRDFVAEHRKKKVRLDASCILIEPKPHHSFYTSKQLVEYIHRNRQQLEDIARLTLDHYKL